MAARKRLTLPRTMAVSRTRNGRLYFWRAAWRTVSKSRLTSGCVSKSCSCGCCLRSAPLRAMLLRSPINGLPFQPKFQECGNWREALDTLHSTNNFPEFTGRICPAPCEAACTVNIDGDAVGIKSIEHFLIDKGGENGWVVPQPAAQKTGKKIAVVGSGQAGLAAAQQLARAGHAVTVFEKNSRIGGLLRYGIPDFKLDKRLIDWRMVQLEAEGVKFQTGTFIGKEAPGQDKLPGGVANDAQKTIAPDALLKKFDAVILAGGAEQPRDLPIPGRELKIGRAHV